MGPKSTDETYSDGPVSSCSWKGRLTLVAFDSRCVKLNVEDAGSLLGPFLPVFSPRRISASVQIVPMATSAPRAEDGNERSSAG